MSFLAPLMLFGAAAASIPVIIHLFFRSRYRTVPWAAMKFLLTSIEQTSRRLKFQELLLLLMRMAVLILLALALARPMTSAFTGAGGSAAVDTVFVFDTSFSMAAREGDVTRLELARESALKIIDQLPPYSAVHVIDISSKPALLGPRVPFNLDQARYLIEGLELTHLPTDFRPGVKEALAVLNNSQMASKECYLFSDMQKLGWEAQEAPLIEDLRDIGEQATVYLVRCGTTMPLNVAVIGLTPQIDIPRPGERVNFSVMIRNTGIEPAKNLQVSLMVDGEKDETETQAIDSLLPGKTATVTLSAKMKNAGLHVVSALVKQDELEADNRLDRVILVRDYVRVLVIDGAADPSKGLDSKTAAQSASYNVGHALRPVKPELWPAHVIQPDIVYTPGQANADLLVDKDLCILVNVALPSKNFAPMETLPAAFLDALDRFVREGHGLIIFPGHKVDPAAYNNFLVEQYGLLPFKLKEQPIIPPKEKPLHFNRDTVNLLAYQALREDKMFQIEDAEIWQALALDETTNQPLAAKQNAAKQEKPGTESATVALRFANGHPAIITHKVDAGEVVLFTMAGHPGWDPKNPEPTLKALPVHFSFVPLVRLTLLHLLQQQAQEHNVTAGQPLNWFAPAKDAKKSFTLLQPDGKKRPLGNPTLATEKDRHVLKLDNLARAGIYALVAQDQSGQQAELLNDPVLIDDLRQGKVNVGLPFAVAPDLSESENLETLTNEQIDAKLGFPVIHATAGSDPGQYAGLDRTNREWTLWLLMLVLFVAVGEAALAWFCGRPI